MRKTMLYAVVFASILILGSFIVVAKNENAPGQWKQTNEYANQREFVRSIHMRIWEKLQERNVNPLGLMKLIGEWMTELETDEEYEDDELEDEEGETEEESEEEEED